MTLSWRNFQKQVETFPFSAFVYEYAIKSFLCKKVFISCSRVEIRYSETLSNKTEKLTINTLSFKCRERCLDVNIL